MLASVQEQAGILVMKIENKVFQKEKKKKAQCTNTVNKK